jgi:hypothetical protein
MLKKATSRVFVFRGMPHAFSSKLRQRLVVADSVRFLPSFAHLFLVGLGAKSNQRGCRDKLQSIFPLTIQVAVYETIKDYRLSVDRIGMPLICWVCQFQSVLTFSQSSIGVKFSLLRRMEGTAGLV